MGQNVVLDPALIHAPVYVDEAPVTPCGRLRLSPSIRRSITPQQLAYAKRWHKKRKIPLPMAHPLDLHPQAESRDQERQRGTYANLKGRPVWLKRKIAKWRYDKNNQPGVAPGYPQS